MIKFSTAIVTITAPGDVVPVKHRMPGDAGRCLSVDFSASVISSDKALAAAGISFNGGKEKTINRMVFNRGTYTRVASGISVDQPLLPGTDVQGHIEDLSAIAAGSYPYNIKMYFEYTTK